MYVEKDFKHKFSNKISFFSAELENEENNISRPTFSSKILVLIEILKSLQGSTRGLGMVKFEHFLPGYGNYFF